MMKHTFVALCAFVIVGLAGTGHASVIYKYTGNTFTVFQDPSGLSPYDNTMNLTMTVELSAPLIPNSFQGSITPISTTINDGVSTYVPTGIFDVTLAFTTDANNNIIDWGGFAVVDFPVPASIGDQSLVVLVAGPVSSPPGGDNVTLWSCAAVDPLSDTCTNEVAMGQAGSNTPGSWSLVPVPPAVYLFGTGLLGLVGMARRKAA